MLEQEIWQKLQGDRNLIYEHKLDEFSKDETKIYLQRIALIQPLKIQQIYRLTQGLPYYLNWIKCEFETNKKNNLVVSVKTIVNFLLQGFTSKQKRILQLTACCRWFNKALIRHLINSPGLNLATESDENFDYFEWLTQYKFVEYVSGYYCLNNVVREVLRLSLWQNDREDFHNIYACLANYFDRLANAEVSPQQSITAQYENPDWRHYISEYLYYILFANVSDAKLQLISHLFASCYLDQSQVVKVPYLAIASETTDLAQHPLLSYEMQKFLGAIRPAVECSWLVLEANIIDFEILKLWGFQPHQIKETLQICDFYLTSLEGLSKFAALLSKSKRCLPNQRMDWLRLALKQAEEIATPSNLVLEEIGNAFYNLGFYEAAIVGYEKALVLKPESDVVWCKRGTALRKLKRYEEAIASYHQALQFQPEQYEIWNSCGIALRKLKRYEEAIASYHQALRLKPDHPGVYYNLGIILDDLGNYEEALSSYEKALQFQPDDCEVWYNRGITLRKLGCYEEALSSYEKALEINPQDSTIWYNRGYVLDELQRYEDAIASYDKAMELEPDDFATWYNRGLALRKLERVEEAIASFDKAIELQPNKYKAWYSRALALRQLGYIEKAIASFEQAAKIQPDDPSTWYNKACCYALQGDIEQTVQNLEKAIIISPDQCRTMAKTDPDFDMIRANELFQICIDEVK